MADLAERLCGPFCHVTTRANLQVREIPPKNAVALIEGIQDLGLCSRGSGADNIRNVTGTPTAGIDPQELLDTREYAREWHYHILNDRSLTGLPRKFNVAFDGAGKIAVLEDTNDIAFSAVEVKDGFGVEPGVWFRLGLGGITGHKDFAKYADIIVKPADATKVSDAIVRVFIDLGDRTNRLKARLKYVHRRHGHGEIPRASSRRGSATPSPACRRKRWRRVRRSTAWRISACTSRSRKGLNWIGVVAAARQGHLRADARACQDRAGSRRRRYPPDGLAEPADLRACATRMSSLRSPRSRQIGLAVEASQIRAGLIACTGNAGCKFAASNTKRHAAEIGDWCEPRVNIDTPLNIHLTGCHHSCAQHYISDIGLIAAKVDVGEDDDPVEGYHLFAGGGFGPDADVGQEVYHDLKAEDAPKTVERLLKAYLAHRASPEETFLTFARRHDGETLRKLADAEVSS